jgi:hypothetical protein
MIEETAFCLRPNQKNMNYNNLWDKVFARYSSQEITHWSIEICQNAEPFKLYALQDYELPTVKSLFLRKPCSRCLPITRTMDEDKVLISVTFKSFDSNIFCAYTNSFGGHVLFCLWERFSSGISPTINYAVFEPQSHYDIGDKRVFIMPVDNNATIKRSYFDFCIDRIGGEAIDTEILGDIQSIFFDLHIEFDGVFCALVQNYGHGEFKGEFLNLKSLWTTRVRIAVESGLPLNMSESLYLATWLFVCGCPAFEYSDALSTSILDIVNSFHDERINKDDFILKMVESGYRRQFSRFVALQLTRCEGESDFIEIIRGLCAPISLNSFLCLDDTSAIVSFKSYIEQDNTGSVSTNEPVECYLTALDSEISRPLLAMPLEMKNEDWTPYEFAEAVYKEISNILEQNPGSVVLGHATSEQSVIDMCCHSTDFEDGQRRGLSIYASHKNHTTCGRGMYFFKVGRTGNFEQLARNGGCDVELISDFQGFMYGLTRCFRTANFCHYLSPALLLFVVPKENLSNITDTSSGSEQLPLLKECKCTCRYDKSFNIQSTTNCEPSPGDGVRVLEECISAQYLNFMERINAVALRSGLVDFGTLKGFEAYVTDGSKLSSIILDIRNLEKREKCDKKAGMKSLPVQSIKGDFMSDIKKWRRPMLGFNYDGNFQNVEPMDMSVCKGTKPEHWCRSVLCCPKEVVITSQDFLKTLLDISDIHVAFLNPDVVCTRRPSNESVFLEQHAPEFITFQRAKVKSTHPYYKNLIQCGDQCRQV